MGWARISTGKATQCPRPRPWDTFPAVLDREWPGCPRFGPRTFTTLTSLNKEVGPFFLGDNRI